MKLGDKIKKARIEAKMTQKELADGKITRNMLSQIENGKATPSVSTLNHITDKLGLPGGYFFADANDEISFKKSLYISDIKDVYLKKNYSDALTLCQAHYVKEDGTEIGTYMSLSLVFLKENWGFCNRYCGTIF